ncbi:MAG: homoserine kinase [Gammaproteobacteria bacterium]|nr:MAG: homoserine kinase [Gammaproteobacteria bacterium]
MSVYTNIEQSELEVFLSNYSLGALVSYQGINAGIENTNYFVTTENGEFVLTIFEEVGFDTLPFYLNFMAHLSDHGMPTAHPIADLHNDYVRVLKDKPAAIVRRLEGKNVLEPNTTHCSAVGHALAQIHTLGDTFQSVLENPRGISWAEKTAERIFSHLSSDEQMLLEQEIQHRKQSLPEDLPKGVIHADLFRDNVMFKDQALTGIIDFYYACNDTLLYDLAVTINDWCSKENGDLDISSYTELMTAYQAQRSLISSEVITWQYMLRAAGLRFWLSRLQDKIFPKDGEITHIKDPDVFKNILLSRINWTPEIIL